MATSLLSTRNLAALAAASFLACGAMAQTMVADSWVRATVQGQQATGAFMKITSAKGAKLVGAASPAAGVTEVHEMKMEGNTMKMAAIDALDLPAGQAVELKPGGYHIMLMQLKEPLAAGATVPITLSFKGADGKTETVEVKAPVKALNTATPSPDTHSH